MFWSNSEAQNYEVIIGKPYKNRHLFLLKNIYNNPSLNNDSLAFFSEVDKLRNIAEKHSDKELIIETEFMFFNFWSSRDYPYYKEEMKRFIAQVDKDKILHLQIRARQALGLHYFYEDMNYAQAISYLSESYQYIKKISTEELPDKQELIYNIAFLYYNVGYYNTAIEYLNIAQKFSNNYYRTLILNILNLEGLIYKEKGDYSKAIISFKELYTAALNQKDSIWIRIAQNNLAELFYNIQMYDSALEILLKSDMIIVEEEVELKILLQRSRILADVYIAKGNTTRAIEEIDTIERLLKQAPSTFIDDKVLPLLAYSKGKKGFFDEAYQMMSQALDIKSKNDNKKIQELIKKSDNKENIEKIFKQQSELENEKKINQILSIGVVLITLLLLTIAFFLIQKQKVKYRQKQMEAELENNKISQELIQAKEELEKITISLLSKNKELDVYRQELKNIENSNTTDKNLIQRAEHLNKLLTQAILTEEKWLEFKKAFEGVYVGYIDQLLIKMPNLTQAELRYIILRKLKLSNKEIASLLGIFPDSIRTYRYRIRKKFNFINDSELDKNIFF